MRFIFVNRSIGFPSFFRRIQGSWHSPGFIKSHKLKRLIIHVTDYHIDISAC